MPPTVAPTATPAISPVESPESVAATNVGGGGLGDGGGAGGGKARKGHLFAAPAASKDTLGTPTSAFVTLVEAGPLAVRASALVELRQHRGGEEVQHEQLRWCGYEQGWTISCDRMRVGTQNEGAKIQIPQNKTPDS